MEMIEEPAMPPKATKLDAFLTHQEFSARFETEKAKVARRYCTLFRFWKDCRFKLCRRVRCCAGEPLACLQLSARRVPRDLQFAARQRLLETTPRNLAAPERAARELMPNTLADVSWGAVKQRDIPPGWRRSGRR
jgi:hypothetical protein